jgi:ketosteroid isomerase-like protein
MTFRETLETHTSSIIARDIESLRSTLPQEDLLLVMSDGKVVRSVSEFLEAHRQWFAMPNWQIRFEPMESYEGPDLGVAVFKLDYSDMRPDHTRSHEFSVLTLIFARQHGRWVMVHDQNTPIKQA